MRCASRMADVMLWVAQMACRPLERIVDYCIDCDCSGDQSSELWPEYELRVSTPRRTRVYQPPPEAR